MADTPSEWERQVTAHTAEARKAFPYERHEVAGKDALAAWERLKANGAGSPIVIGGDEEFDRMAEIYFDNAALTVERILSEAVNIQHIDGLRSFRSAERLQLDNMIASDPNLKDAADAMRAEVEGAGGDFADLALGEWPLDPPSPTALTVAEDWQSGPLERVHIVILPTADWTEIPAYLKWGGWNECPPPAYHIAALRSWRDRYGAELIGLSDDVMNIRVASRPKTKEEAIALAQEQFEYCEDIIYQGVGTISNLAASLKAHNWWYFWWD